MCARTYIVFCVILCIIIVPTYTIESITVMERTVQVQYLSYIETHTFKVHDMDNVTFL